MPVAFLPLSCFIAGITLGSPTLLFHNNGFLKREGEISREDADAPIAPIAFNPNDRSEIGHGIYYPNGTRYLGKRIRIKFLEWVFNREAKRSILILRGLRSGRFDGVVSQANSFSSNVPEVAFSSSFSAKPCRDVAKFNSNRARIGEEADLLLEQIAAYLIDHPEFAVLVYGHSDITGSAEHNWDLGARRAQAMVFSRDG